MAGFFKGLFAGKAKPDPEKPSPPPKANFVPATEESPALTAMKRAVAEKAKTDPTAPLMFTIDQVLNSILETAQDKRGVNVETLLGLIGSLGGYSCHVAARSSLAQLKPDELKLADYMEVKTKAGTTFTSGI